MLRRVDGRSSSPARRRASAPHWPRTSPAQGDTVALVARRADRLEAVLDDCIATSPASERWAADLSDPAGSRPSGPADLGLLRRVRRARQQCRRPDAPARHPPDHGRGRADDANQLLLPRRHLAGRTAADARTQCWHDRERLEPRRPVGHNRRSGLFGLEIRTGGLERVHGGRSRWHRRVGEAHHSGSHRHGDLGPA